MRMISTQSRTYHPCFSRPKVVADNIAQSIHDTASARLAAQGDSTFLQQSPVVPDVSVELLSSCANSRLLKAVEEGELEVAEVCKKKPTSTKNKDARARTFTLTVHGLHA